MTKMLAPIDVVCVASWNADLVSQLERPPIRGETLLAQHFSISPGGKGSNAAVAAARQGARVGLLARIGQDAFGAMGLTLWQREGIDATHVEQAANESSGVAQIWVYADGDNSIAVCPGAGAGLSAAHADAAQPMLAQCKVVMASCEVPLAATARAFALARAGGALTLLNPAPAMALPATLLPQIDLLTPNETELRTVAGVAADTPIDAAAQALLERGVGAVLVTLGAAGCRLLRSGHAPIQLPGLTMQVVDTIGAGDTFTGALAAHLAQGATLETSMRRANAAAALSVTGTGAIGGMPTQAQVRALLATI